ncbi:S8 family peptidase [Microbacterium sp. P26]|uniref:S8 family peptidase n=1 Tax=Microbacterium TaxID=33882 RepID=UPI00203ED0B6|nr:S8 family serine peptidase [Microbacterium sp. P26]MCM3500409.1 S8 family peptidase [Microbacterium sp. P26]
MWSLSLAVALLVSAGVTAAVVAPSSQNGVASTAASRPPAGSPTAGVGPAAGDTDAAAESWSAQFGVPADATDEERLRIKASFDIVTVPLADKDALTALPGITLAGPMTLDDTFMAAVPHAQTALVRESFPDAEIEPNSEVTPDGDQSPAPSWGLDVVDNSDAARDDHYLYDATGAGTTIFVIDSGVRASNADFGGRVDTSMGRDFINDGNGLDDCSGHGTAVAGIAGSTTYGVAKQAKIVPVRVFGCTGGGLAYDFLNAVKWIVDTYPPDRMVINMSLGMGRWATLNSMVNYAATHGFVVVVSAGNNARDACTQSPAAAESVITVGAFDEQRSYSSYSNYGKCVKTLAPGDNIATIPIQGAIAYATGTSMATPHVAGLAARLLEQHPTWTTADVLAFLNTPAAAGHISNVPTDTVNFTAAIPMVPRITSLTTGTTASGMSLAWTTNGIGTFTSFSITVTDTTTGRAYPVTVSGDRSSTVFTDVQAGHAYSVSITGSARMPSGAELTADPVTAVGP